MNNPQLTGIRLDLLVRHSVLCASEIFTADGGYRLPRENICFCGYIAKRMPYLHSGGKMRVLKRISSSTLVLADRDRMTRFFCGEVPHVFRDSGIAGNLSRI